MIRLRNNVPSYYVEQSRDFQLLCCIYDLINFEEKNNVDAVSTLTSPSKTKSTLLKLMCTKVGFFTKYYLDDDILRSIVTAFPFILKQKGTLQGIALAVNTVLKAENNPAAVERISFIVDKQNYIIRILTPIKIYNKIALKELLRYVVPAGVDTIIQTYVAKGDTGLVDTTIYQKDIYDIISMKTLLSSAVRGSNSEYPRGISINTDPANATPESRLIGTYNESQVIGFNEVFEFIGNDGNSKKYKVTRTDGTTDIIYIPPKS